VLVPVLERVRLTDIADEVVEGVTVALSARTHITTIKLWLISLNTISQLAQRTSLHLLVDMRI